MKISLNKNFYLTQCLSCDIGAKNGFNFDAQDEWVIKIDNGKQFATRFTFTTLYAKKNKFYFQCDTAKSAIQQCLVYNFSEIKLKNIYFTIEKNFTKEEEKETKKIRENDNK